MFRRWLALVLLVLQLQPALGLVPEQGRLLALEIEHGWVHESGQGHHHEDTLAFQLDEEGAAPSHFHHDAGHPSALPLDATGLCLPASEPAPRMTFPGGRLPAPHLEGPLRPPQRSV